MDSLSLKAAALAAGKSMTRLRQAIAEGKLQAAQVQQRGRPAYRIEREALSAYLALPDGRTLRKGLVVKSAPKRVAPVMLDVVVPPDVKYTKLPSHPPRFQVVELPTVARPCTDRAGSQDFRQYQHTGGF